MPTGAPVKHATLVLVVDAVAASRGALRKTLEAAAFEVIEAEGGQQAISVLEDREVDLVIADLERVPLDGLAMINWVLQQPADQLQPKIIACSSNESVKTILDLLKIPLLLKPIAPRDLLSAVLAALGLRGPVARCNAN